MAAEAAAAQPLPADLVLTLGEVDSRPVVQLLARYGLTVNILGDGANLPGSSGDPKAPDALYSIGAGIHGHGEGTQAAGWADKLGA